MPEDERTPEALPKLPLAYYQALPREYFEDRVRSRATVKSLADFIIGDRIKLRRDMDAELEDETKRFGFKPLPAYREFMVIGTLTDGMLLVQDRDESMYWVRDTFCKLA